MNKRVKYLSIIFSVLLLVSISVMSIAAETIYVVNGFSYTIINNSSISICGWDNRTTDLIIPDSIAMRYVTKIANWGLSDNEELTSLDLSQAGHLDSIGVRALAGCTSLGGEIVIPESVTDLNSGAFLECSSLSSADFQANITVLKREMFYGCTSLNDVKLPQSLTEIQDLAFAYCSSLEYLEIPAGVENVGDAVFLGDENLVLGVYKDTVGHQYAVDNRIDHIVLDGDKLGDVNFDGSVDILDSTEIQKYAAEKTDFTDEQFELGDINKDGFVDVMDALLVQKHAIGSYDIPPIIVRY